jgi:predicted O-linked N-acetylglucosamine transferase (SPINDLY family)
MSDAVQRLIDSGALEEAARALDAAPDVRLLLRLAAALQERNRGADALACYQRILEIDPANGEALLCLAVLHEDASVDQGRAYMDRYIHARPRDAAGHLRRALMLPAIAQSTEHIDQVTQRLDGELDAILSGRFPPIPQPEFEVGATPFFLAYYGRNPRPLVAKVARACRSVYPTQTECRRKLFSNGKRLRIGFISAHFYEHSVGKTLYGFIRDLPRDQYEVLVFALAPRADEWNARLRSAADRYTELPLEVAKAREAIAAANLDIAFFADLGMDPVTYFLAYWRLAPLQAATWGHSVTSGIDTVDYYVSHDAVEIPNAQEHYTERLIRLPGYFVPRYLKPPLPSPRAARARGRRYHCPQNLFKLHPDFDSALRGILERDAEAQIVLVDSNRPWTGQLDQRLQRSLGAYASRVHIAPRMSHAQFLEHLAGADVVLDPFYFGGWNSSCDAFALGVPIVTLPGFLLPGRYTGGLYQEMGVEGAVASSPEDYVDIALRLARDEPFREQISGRSGRLFDRADSGRALGAALWEVAERSR